MHILNKNFVYLSVMKDTYCNQDTSGNLIVIICFVCVWWGEVLAYTMSLDHCGKPQLHK